MIITEEQELKILLQGNTLYKYVWEEKDTLERELCLF